MKSAPGKHPAPQSRRRQNLEFDFAGLQAAPRKPRATRAAPSRSPAVPVQPQEGVQARTISSADAAAAAARPAVLAAPRPVTQEAPPAPLPPSAAEAGGDDSMTPVAIDADFIHQPRKEPTMANTPPHPTPISARRSIDRQVREQHALTTLLHGAGLALVSTILVVAGLAALGGYVLYKQLQDQSATIALLEQNTKQRMFEMEMDLTRRDTELAKNLEQSNLRLTALTSQFEQHRYQTTQTLSELRARNRELERQLSLYQKKVNDQQSIIARLR